ncbi:MAG: HD family phosphohydrolase [Dehalococcoidia bacterium]
MFAPLFGGTSQPFGRVLAFAGLVFALLTAVLFPVLPSTLDVSIGDIAAQTIRAPRNLSYESEVVRAQLQDQAVRDTREVVTYNVSAKSEQLARLTDIVNRVGSLRDSPGMVRSAKEDGLTRIPGLSLTATQRAAVLDLTSEGWRQVLDESVRVLGSILEEPFSGAELEDRRASVPARVASGLTSTQGDLVGTLVKPLVVQTQRIDETETQRARERAAAAIGPQQVTYAHNQVIVREGEPMDAAKLEALEEAGLLDVRIRTGDLVAVLLIALLAAGSLGVYLLVLKPESLSSMRRLALVAVLIGAVVLAAKLYLPLVTPDSDRRFYAFALPVALAPLLIGSLFEAPFAILVAAVLAIVSTFTAVYLPDITGIVGLGGPGPLQMTAAYFFGGLAGVLAIHRAERLNRFALAGVAVAAVTFVSLLAFWAMDDLRESPDLLWMAGNSIAAGALTALLAVGLSVVLGAAFDVTTRLQLMELAQLNAPLLRRLQEEAPGTFHHSIMVGNLAERAADKIGADSLLVRVGSYYHDIGKMGRPAFYIENQLAGENPHERLDSETSARLIQEHVRHGTDLARRRRLPERVRAFIPEHHGTRLVTYFYRIATRDDPDIDPERFRYPGPRPQSRETALVMLADSTEAVVRASQDRSQEAIDALVESVIAERVAEGQFDDCDLTLRDLRTIAESFKSSLRAIYHPRIEYPPAVEKERRESTAAGVPVNGAVAQGTVADELEPEPESESDDTAEVART